MSDYKQIMASAFTTATRNATRQGKDRKALALLLGAVVATQTHLTKLPLPDVYAKAAGTMREVVVSAATPMKQMGLDITNGPARANAQRVTPGMQPKLS